jgi:predicted flap endonuclease-1-like 5' DNA nuclease
MYRHDSPLAAQSSEAINDGIGHVLEDVLKKIGASRFHEIPLRKPRRIIRVA